MAEQSVFQTHGWSILTTVVDIPTETGSKVQGSLSLSLSLCVCVCVCELSPVCVCVACST